ISKTHQWTKAGLIVRTGSAPEQMNIGAIVTPDRMVTHQRRTSNNSDTTSEKKPGFDLPRWVKIERRGEKFTTFHSADGQKWEEIAADTVKMHTHTLIGLVLSSHDDSKTATAEFDNVSYTKK
ncbi:MAG TPA: hypothetical protein VFG14_17525, partial [Chthoniobacteraceae bacterium]|nr:hypothetical protein [Chthoniobacteraceae bacterium]